MRLLPILFLSFFFLISNAAAVEDIHQDHIKNFSLQAPEGLSLSGVELYNLAPDSNVSLVLDNYGELYTLQINSTRSFFSWWNFDVSLTNPNGTTEHKTLKSLAPVAYNYDVHVQYFWQGFNNTIDTSYFNIDLYTGVLPLNCMLNEYNPTASKALQFSQISTSSDSYYDLVCYAVNAEEFEKQFNNDPLAPLFELTGDFFSWTWENIIILIEKIPGVGVHLAAVLLLTAMTIDSIIFYTKLLFIDYSETTFLTIEFFILSYSFTKRGTFWTKLKRVVESHVKVVEMTISMAQATVHLFSSIVSTIAAAINALKPV